MLWNDLRKYCKRNLLRSHNSIFPFPCFCIHKNIICYPSLYRLPITTKCREIYCYFTIKRYIPRHSAIKSCICVLFKYIFKPRHRLYAIWIISWIKLCYTIFSQLHSRWISIRNFPNIKSISKFFWIYTSSVILFIIFNIS